MGFLSKLFGSEDNAFGGGPQQPFPRQWQDWLREHVWQYPHLRRDRQHHLEQVVALMHSRRRWSGGNEFEVTDEMKVAIAGQAGLMTLGLDEPYCFDHVPDIIVYEKPFYVTNEQASTWSTDPIFGTAINSPRLGEAWHRGPIILAWESIRQPYSDVDGYRISVVVHEFTHHLDGLDGDVSGTPPLESDEQLEEWYRVTEADYLQLAGHARREEETLLSHYGASNRAEFFAVATECFFDQPHELRDQHAHLYGVLAKYFRQSPADYLPRAAQPPPRSTKYSHTDMHPKLELRKAIHNDAFARGVSQFNDGNFADAVESLTVAVAENAADSEAYSHRALAYVELDQPAKALRDAETALQLDPEDTDAQTAIGAAHTLRGEHSLAIHALKEVCEEADSVRARLYLAQALLGLDDPKRAMHHLTLAIAWDELNERAYKLRAQARRALGDEAGAAEDQQRAHQIEPT